jgi:hypothetical protein
MVIICKPDNISTILPTNIQNSLLYNLSVSSCVPYKPNKFFSPGYLLKLANAQEANKQPKEALATYTEITEKYPQSAESVPAKKYKALLESSISE